MARMGYGGSDVRLPLSAVGPKTSGNGEMEHSALTRQQSALPLRRAGEHVDGRLAGVLAALNTATDEREIGHAVAWHAASMWLARGVAVAVAEGAAVRLVGSVGYDCDTMAPGVRLPLTAGLPLTEAARTGNAVVQRSADG